VSATNRGAPRREHDDYRTPMEFALACVQATSIPRTASVLDPCAGTATFGSALRSLGHTGPITERDVSPRHEVVTQLDYLEDRSPRGEHFDWIIGNPPYGKADEFVTKALTQATEGVAFLLRLGFLAGQRRASNLYSRAMPDVHVLSRRPSFTADGRTDAADYGWFVWRRFGGYWRVGGGDLRMLRVPVAARGT